MNPTHFERNRQTRPHWDDFHSHRVHVTQLLVDAGIKPAANDDDGKLQLCILGAGNCNDLDLNRLGTTYEQISLVDIDRDAMEFGVARQNRAGLVDIVCCDVMRDDLPDVQYDVVASTCLLTQLLVDIDPSSAQTEDYAIVRRQHFLTMLQLMKPAAAGVFVTDIVSSDTVPNLAEHNRDQLAQQLPHWIQARNFFTGTNPAVIHHLLTADTEIASQLDRVEPIAPWLWNPGPRTYACYGMQFTRG